jgi:release factor glutamine methyltransferase
MQLLGDILKKATLFLDQKKVSEPRLSAEWLLATMLGMNRVDLYLNFDRPLNEQELDTYRSRIARRVKHEPISYIIGNHSFFGLILDVDVNVLIPRHETEELVELVLKDLKEQSALTVLDLCTGSGAIACSLKNKAPQHSIHASDVSEKALNIAKLNAQKYNLPIAFHTSDLLSNISGKFDIIVSNPPYIAKKDQAILADQVFKYEPHLALFGGEDGLDFYKLMQAQFPSFLNNNARIYLEIGFDQAERVLDLFSQAPYYNARCLKDSNQNNRFVIVDFKN